MAGLVDRGAELWDAGQPGLSTQVEYFSVSRPNENKSPGTSSSLCWASRFRLGDNFLFNTSKFLGEKNTSSWGARRLQGLWWPPLPRSQLWALCYEHMMCEFHLRSGSN